MKKRLISLLLSLILVLSVCPVASLAAEPIAHASTQMVLIDGKAVEMQAYALLDANGYPTNYVKLRDVAYLLNGTAAQFEVTWDGSVNVVTGRSYTANGSEMKTPFSGNRAYKVSTTPTKVNGTPVNMDAIILTDDSGGGYTYYKLRDLGAQLGFFVDWSAEKGIFIETGGQSSLSTERSDEVRRAYEAGLIPEDWLTNLDAPMTFQDYSALLRKLTENDKGLNPAEWDEITKLAKSSDDTMKREDGIVMLSYWWDMLGLNDEGEDVFLWVIDELQPDYYADWSMVNTQLEEASRDYPLFPNWQDTAYGMSNYLVRGAKVLQDVISPVTGEPVFSRDENDSLRLQSAFTRDDAVRAAVRIADYCKIELDPEWREYIDLSDAGTYDKSIITDALLNAPSDLPEVTQEKLPSQWQGAGTSVRKIEAGQYIHFAESDIRFLSENGFNFTRLFFDFDSLSYPDFPEDYRQVNRKELEELDQLLAWCIEYDVHLQIAMWRYLDEDGNTIDDGNLGMPRTEKEWQVTKEYWEMLAERYADIPSKYLSFDLCNEVHPGDNVSFAKQGLSTVVSAIRAADSDRVLLYSYAGGPLKISWAEAIASLGVAIGCHPYYPTYIANTNFETARQNPYAEPAWPLPFLPSAQISRGEAPLTITGAIGGSKLSMYFSEANVAKPQAVVYADGELLARVEVSTTKGEDGYSCYGELYSVDLPADTKKVEIKMEGGLSVETLILEGSAGKTVIMPHDAMSSWDDSEPLPIVVNEDGSYTNSENRYITADDIYKEAILPYREIAEKYGVGFMVNEFGVAGTKVFWDIDTVVAYHETMLELLEKYDIGWCYCELANDFPKHLVFLYGEEMQWEGATEDTVVFTYEDGTTETVKICRDLLDLFHEYTDPSNPS